MHIGLITPFASTTRGNAISAWRLRHGLTQVGVKVTLCGLDASEGIGPCIEGVDVIHALHAYRTGRLLLNHRANHGSLPPVVLSFTGTDLAYDLKDPERESVVRQACDLASAIVVYHEAAKEELSERLPSNAGKIHIIAPAVHLAGSETGLRTQLGLPADAFVFLFPAGVRPVKNLLFPLPLLAELQREHPHLRAVFAGPIIDQDEGHRLKAMLVRFPWAHYAGVIPHEKMAGIYAEADVVVNTSHHEGLANAVLEAMYMGRPVLASDIPANAAVIRHGVNGLLYDSPDAFCLQASRLLTARTLRETLGEASATFVREHYSLDAEMAGYKRLYHQVAGA